MFYQTSCGWPKLEHVRCVCGGVSPGPNTEPNPEDELFSNTVA